MSYIKQLQEIGLKQQEAEIYLACLRLGMAKVAELAEEVDVPRTSIYVHLENLLEKGFIKKSKKGSVEYFAPVEPTDIFQNIKEKTDGFASVLPQLTKMMDFAGKKPKIEFYDTKQGMLKLCEKALKFNPKHIAYAIETGEASASGIEKLGGLENNKNWQEKFLKQGLAVQEVATKDVISLIKDLPEKNKKVLRMRNIDVRAIDEKDFPFSINLLLFYPDNVFIMVPQDNFIVMMENKNIYTSLLTLYKILFAKAEPIDIKKLLE